MTDPRQHMSLADRLAAQPSASEPKYTPHTEFDGATGFIQTGPMSGQQPADYTQILEQFGYDTAQVRVAGNPRVSRWQQRARNRETNQFETVWLQAYRFHLEPVTETAVSPGVEAIIGAARAERRPATGPHWLCFQAGDLQIGKRSADGSTEQIVERFVQSIETARTEHAHLKRHGIEGIQVCFPGDCIEGNQSQRGRNQLLTQELVTEQFTIFQRLIMLTVEAFAPLCERLFVDVVNGNHDDAQRDLNTYPGNGWATTAATTVSDALTLNPLAFGHVEVRIPQKWRGHMTVPVGDTIVTVVHGHQWGRDKAMNWWSEQALGNHPAGASQILQCGHWHEFQIRSNADRTIVMSPTYDCGSDWLRERHGSTSKRGGLLYLLRAGEVSRLSVV